MSERDQDGHREEPELEHREKTGHLRLHPPPEAGVCERCGTTEHVHRGLCHHCRELPAGEHERVAIDHVEHPHQAPPIPLRNPPWRRRGA